MEVKIEKDNAEIEKGKTGDSEKSEDDFFQGQGRKPVKDEYLASQCGRHQGCAGHVYEQEHGPRDLDYFEKIRTSSIAALRRKAKEHEVLLTSQNSVI